MTPFRCANLVHHWDHLAGIYSRQLQNVLASIPGCAVQEVSEAAELRKEWSLTGKTKTALVELIVDVSYRVVADSEPVEVQFSTRIASGGGELKTLRKSVPFRSAKKYLAGELSDAIREQQTQTLGGSANAADRTEYLANCADVHAEVGEWHKAVVLREALLLVDPTAHTQRKKLVGECIRYMGTFFDYGPHKREDDFNLVPGNRKWEQWCAQLADEYWYPALIHLEHLMRNKQISLSELIPLAKVVGGMNSAYFGVMHRDPPSVMAAAEQLFTLHNLPPVSLEQLDKERETVRAEAAAIGDELEKLRAGEVPDKHLGTLNKHVANLAQKLARIRKDRHTAEKRARIEERIAALQEKLSEVEQRLSRINRTTSRLLLLIDEQYVRPNFRKKAMLDATRITCRNVFRQPFDIFRPIYNNRRDDHEVLRQLSRSPGFVIRHRDRVDIYLTPALHRQPAQWKRIETFIAICEHRIRQAFGVKVRFLLNRTDKQIFAAVMRAQTNSNPA